MNAVNNMSSARLWAAYFGEMRFEFIKSLRTPAFAVPTLLFPIMFYLMFGIFFGSMRGSSNQAVYLFATYGVFGAMGPGLFGFGVSLAIEREQGLLTLKQALPQPPGAYLLARAFMAMLFVAIISIMLTLMAVLVGEVPLTFLQTVQLFAIDVFGALPFCAIGMFVGSMVSGQASPAIVNLIFLPMAFLSGLWVPMQFMPAILGGLRARSAGPPPGATALAPLARQHWHDTRPHDGPRRRDAAVLPARGAAHAWQRLQIVRSAARSARWRLSPPRAPP